MSTTPIPPAISDVAELLRQRRGVTTSGPSFTPPPLAGIRVSDLQVATT
jgi:hypothetical protein